MRLIPKNAGRLRTAAAANWLRVIIISAHPVCRLGINRAVARERKIIGLARAIKRGIVTANTDLLTLANKFPNGPLGFWRDDAANFYAGTLTYGMILGRLMRHESGIISNDLPNGWGDYIAHDVKVPTSW